MDSSTQKQALEAPSVPTAQPLNQSPPQPMTNTDGKAKQSYEQQMVGEDVVRKRQKTVRTLGIVSFVLGCVAILWTATLYVVFGIIRGQGFIGSTFASIMAVTPLIINIICLITITLTIITMILGIKRKVKKPLPYILVVLGLIFSFLPYVCSGIMSNVRRNDDWMSTDPLVFNAR